MSLSLSTLHPLFSEFPLPLLVLFVIFEMRDQWLNRPFSPVFMGRTVVLSAFASYLSGYLAKDHASLTFSVPADAIMFHQSLGLATVISLLLLSLSCELMSIFPQHRFLRIVMRTMLAISLLTTIFTNHFGGSLVFDYGAGVRATP